MFSLNEKSSGSISIALGIVAALLAGQIAKSYNLGIVLSILITIIIAVISWYVINFFGKRKKDEASH